MHNFLRLRLGAAVLCTVLAVPVAGMAQDQPPAPPAATLTGIVSAGPREAPLADAVVEAFPLLDRDDSRSLRLQGAWLPAPLAQAVTGIDGRFSLALIEKARAVILVASAPGHARSRREDVVLPRGGKEPQDTGRMHLAEGRRITGKVMDENGKPVGSARVLAHVSLGGGGAMPPFPVTAITAEDGSFTLESVPGRPVTVHALKEGKAPAVVETTHLARLSLKLEPGLSLAGKVMSADGTSPAAGAWVMAGPEGADGLTRSGDDGAFRLEHLRPGVHALAAELTAAGAAASRGGTLQAPSSTISIEVGKPVPDGEKIAPLLRLRPGGLVRVRVIEDGSRDPVAGALVTLEGAGDLLPRPAWTGSDGSISFPGVASGRFSLSAAASGFLDADLSPTPLAAGEIWPWTAALRPAATVAGTVRDISGRPVAAARITVLSAPDLPIRIPATIMLPMRRDPTESDIKGRFALEQLPAGRDLKIKVEARGHAPWQSDALRLRGGERRGKMEILLERGGSITGHLQDGDGAPVAGAQILASHRAEGGGNGMVFMIGRRGGGRGGGGRGGRLGGGETLPAVFSDAEGAFNVDGVREGVVTLEITAGGFAPRTVPGFKVESADAQVDAGLITLDPGARLSGRVVSASGEAVALARGTVRSGPLPFGGTEFPMAADGTFTSPDLVPGEAVTLRVEADGHAAAELAGLLPPRDDLVVTLPAAARILGTVLDRHSRQPVTDFTLSVARDRSAGGGGRMIAMSMPGAETAFQSADGTFVLDDVEPGRLALTVRAPGLQDSTLRDLEVGEGEDLEDVRLEMDGAATVAGTVSDDRGNPLSGVRAARQETSRGPGIRLGSGNGGAVTDGDGRFRLDGLERGPMTLIFTHEGFEPHDRDVDTTQDIDNLAISLSAGATLTGVVVRDDDSAPVANATVNAQIAGGDRFSGTQSATTAGDGSFALAGLSPGRYTLRAAAPALTAATLEDVVVDSGALPPPFEFRLAGGVTLTGEVIGVRDNEIASLTVRAFTSGGGFSGASTPVDASGRFILRGLAPGTLNLFASSGLADGRSASTTVEIPAGVTSHEAVIEFPVGHTVEGKVQRGEQPVSGATLIFTHVSSRTVSTATSDTTGQYRAGDLEPGEHQVNVMQMSTGISYRTDVKVTGDRRLDIAIPLTRITGYVSDAATGRPLDRATVEMKREGDTAAPAAGARRFGGSGASTDASGYFSLEALEDGIYNLTARRDGYGFEMQSVPVGPGAASDDLRFELSPVPALTLRATDALSGLPLRSLTALALAGGGGDPLGPSGTGALVVFQGGLQADAANVFRLNSLQPGTYTLVLGGEGLGTETLEAVTVPGNTSVALAPAGNLEITLPSLAAGDTARAVLLDGQGRPAHVSLRQAEPAFTLRGGVANQVRNLRPGTYVLRVSFPGGNQDETPVAVLPQITQKVSVGN